MLRVIRDVCDACIIRAEVVSILCLHLANAINPPSTPPMYFFYWGFVGNEG